jgi:cyclin-dependent kinase
MNRVEALFPRVANPSEFFSSACQSIVEIGKQFRREPQTVALAMRILNDYLYFNPVDDSRRVEKCGITCLLIADDLNEINSESRTSTRSLVSVSQMKSTRFWMEGFDLRPPWTFQKKDDGSNKWCDDNDYETLEKITKGSYGTVYKVTRNGKTFAMKTQEVNYASLNELSILSTYSHENIVGLVFKSMSTTEINLYLEYGTVLSDIVKSTEDGWERIYVNGEQQFEPKYKNYILDICNGVKYLHSHEIIHRDLKPQNIIIINGKAKIADFGTALQGVLRDNDFAKKFEDLGTVWYRSLELLNGDRNYSFEVDVWALACIIFEIKTPLPLFPGQDETEVKNKIGRFFSASFPLSSFDPVVRNILLDMLKPKPSRISSDEAYSRFLIHF